MVYRSDEGAAQARADALQIELDRASAELAATKAKLVATERARNTLASHLRHHPSAVPPASPRMRGAALGVLGIVFALGLCARVYKGPGPAATRPRIVVPAMPDRAIFEQVKASDPGNTLHGRDVPEALDRVLILDGITAIRPAVMACGDQSPAHGQVKVSVVVHPEGRVARVTVKTTPSDVLGQCVATAIEHAVFANTESGGSFTYPFVF